VFDLGLLALGGSVNDFVDLLRELEEVQLDEVLEAELWRLVVDGLASDDLKLFPVPVHHERGSELVDQREDSVHVLDSLIQGKECFPVLDVFVLCTLRVALLGLHILYQLHQDLSVDLLPKGRLPGLKLEIDQRYQIPHLLEEAELSTAVLELLVGGFLNIEESLKVVQIRGLQLDLSCVVVVLSDLGVGIRYDLRGGLSDVVRALALELHSVFSNLDLELSESIFDVSGLLSLKRKNLLLDWAANIKDRLRKFEIKVAEYRMQFQAQCPYHITQSSPEIISNAYAKITEYYNHTGEIE
jgi:hypothetical protein